MRICQEVSIKQAKIKDWAHFVNSEKMPQAGLFMKLMHKLGA